MLHRDLLKDPKVIRKNKKGKAGYKPLDNRDHLPFSVRKVTPDPYTHSEIKKSKQTRQGNNNKRTRTDLEHHLLTRRRTAPILSTNDTNNKSNKNTKNNKDQTTPSRLIQSNAVDGKDTSTMLGEFQLDKSTTSGDIIVVGNKEYQVQTARCQYKYAGGQRFVMVRKILEVKELTRVLQEELAMKRYVSSPTIPDHPPDLE
jgi:hypothetical protein